jgi:hypothetical protein
MCGVIGAQHAQQDRQALACHGARRHRRAAAFSSALSNFMQPEATVLNC